VHSGGSVGRVWRRRWARRSRTGTVVVVLGAGRGTSAASSTFAPRRSPPSGTTSEVRRGLRPDWGRCSGEGNAGNHR
jgi:hypothetical protein